MLHTPLMQSIPIEECHEPLIDVRVAGGLRYGPPPECPETEPHYCLLREGVYRRLLTVQQTLPSGFYLRLYEGLRSLAVQQQLFDEELARVKQRHPAIEPEAAYRETCRLVSPVTQLDGSPNIPPHSTGGAVDIEIVDDDGRVIDFGMEIRDWVKVPPAHCLPDAPGLTNTAAANRQLLAQAMITAGFAAYDQEWWHFSYGDRHWAATTGAGHAIYGRCPD